MAIKHNFVSPVTDLGNPNEVGPDEWNDTHYLTASAPVNQNAPGVQGDIAYGSDGALYLCYQQDMWVKFTGALTFTNTNPGALLLRDAVSFLQLRDAASHLLFR